jgi:hypothetical protein
MNKAARLDALLAEATVDCYNEEWLEVPQDILDSVRLGVNGLKVEMAVHLVCRGAAIDRQGLELAGGYGPTCLSFAKGEAST